MMLLHSLSGCTAPHCTVVVQFVAYRCQLQHSCNNNRTDLTTPALQEEAPPKKQRKKATPKKDKATPTPKKTPKKKKDPNSPKRGLSAYMCFSNDKRAEVKEENPGARFASLPCSSVPFN